MASSSVCTFTNSRGSGTDGSSGKVGAAGCVWAVAMGCARGSLALGFGESVGFDDASVGAGAEALLSGASGAMGEVGAIAAIGSVGAVGFSGSVSGVAGCVATNAGRDSGDLM